MHMYVGKQGGGVAAQEEGHKRTFSKKRWFFENTIFETDHPLARMIKKKKVQVSNARNEKGAIPKYAIDKKIPRY